MEKLRANKAILQDRFGIAELGLFGSYARNLQTKKSDVDILVEFRPGVKYLLETRLELEDFLKKIFDTEVDVAHLKYVRPYFREKILRHAIFV
ncbi:MAG TPA: nucleotidyltransferase family protein [Saprospiraceae bacterium]|nr:nucleotidyltransferase family protein [Saprospiraceae bacterium]